MKRVLGLFFGTVCFLCAQTSIADNASQDAAVERSPCANTNTLDASDSDYGRGLIKAIAGQIFYLDEAVKANQTGTVVLCLRVGRRGEIDHVRVEQSTGYPLLDGSVLYAAGLVAAVNEGRIKPVRGTRTPIRRNFIAPPPSELLSNQKERWFRLSFSFGQAKADGSEERPSHGVQSRAIGVDPIACSHSLDDQSSISDAAREGARKAEVDLSRPEFARYVLMLQQTIAKEAFYPRAAQLAEIEGKVSLFIVLKRDGSLACAEVLKTSGEAVLDGGGLLSAGYADAHRAFPRIPDEIEGATIRVKVPINFQLQ